MLAGVAAGDELAQLVSWRRERLELLGLPHADAELTAQIVELDLALVEQLVIAGCPWPRAVRIAS